MPVVGRRTSGNDYNERRYSRPGRMIDATAEGASRVLALVFTDLVDSTGLKRRLGDRPAGALIARNMVDVGHFDFPPSFLLRETLDWLDRYLGPVRKTAPSGGIPSGA